MLFKVQNYYTFKKETISVIKIIHSSIFLPPKNKGNSNIIKSHIFIDLRHFQRPSGVEPLWSFKIWDLNFQTEFHVSKQKFYRINIMI